jgi:hypothetical protein
LYDITLAYSNLSIHLLSLFYVLYLYKTAVNSICLWTCSLCVSLVSQSGCKSTSFFLTGKFFEKKFLFFICLAIKLFVRFADGKGNSFLISVQLFFALFSQSFEERAKCRIDYLKFVVHLECGCKSTASFWLRKVFWMFFWSFF